MAIVVFAIYFIYKKHQAVRREEQRQKEEEKEKDNQISESLKIVFKKEAEFFDFLFQSKGFYRIEDAKLIEEMKEKYDEVKKNAEEALKFDYKKANAETVERAIAKTGSEAFFMPATSEAKDVFVPMLNTRDEFSQIGLSFALVEFKFELYGLLLKKITSEARVKRELLEKCESFLEEELKLHVLAHELNKTKLVEIRLDLASLVLAYIRSEKIQDLEKKYKVFFERSAA